MLPCDGTPHRPAAFKHKLLRNITPERLLSTKRHGSTNCARVITCNGAEFLIVSTLLVRTCTASGGRLSKRGTVVDGNEEIIHDVGTGPYTCALCTPAAQPPFTCTRSQPSACSTFPPKRSLWHSTTSDKNRFARFSAAEPTLVAEAPLSAPSGSRHSFCLSHSTSSQTQSRSRALMAAALDSSSKVKPDRAHDPPSRVRTRDARPPPSLA